MRIRSWACHPDFPDPDDSNFRGCWEFELKPGERTVPHLHEDGDEISITLEGSGEITVGDVSREVRVGEVIFIPAQTSHFLTNTSSPLLRGITVETEIALPGERVACDAPRATVRDLEEVVTAIPENLDESEALQLIIQLFDLAGHLSEQIEDTIGLESGTGYEALTEIQKRVMSAVVQISATYQDGLPGIPRF